MIEADAYYDEGNVGIGTNVPSHKLTVFGNAKITGDLGVDGGVQLGSTANATAGTLRYESGDFEGYDGTAWHSLISGGSKDSVWGLNGADAYYDEGNVGVGTDSPTSTLSVLAPEAGQLTGSAISNTFKVSAGTLGTTAGSKLKLSSVGFRTGGNDVALGVTALRYTDGSNWYSTALGLGMDVDNTDSAGGVLWFNNDKIGIGTTSPVEKLDVAGVIRSSGSATGVSIRNPNNNAASVNLNWSNDIARIRYGGDGVGAAGGFQIQGVGNSVKFHVSNSGNVGIGTTNPGAKLHVGGSNGLGRGIEGILHVGGYNNIYDNQYMVFPNPAQTDRDGMHWWSSDMYIGREKNSFNWGFKETHESGLGNAEKNIISAIVSDHGGYTNLSKLLLAPDGGNVGIGTTSPVRPLHVKSTYPEIQFTTSSTNKSWHIGGTGNNFEIVETDERVRMSFKEGGDICIGACD